MKKIFWRSGLLLSFPLLLSSAGALILPVAEDTSSTAAGKINSTTGKAATLSVTAKERAFLVFDLSTLPVTMTSSNIASARLNLYISSLTTPGDLTVHVVTNDWREITANMNAPGFLSNAVGTIPKSALAAKTFIEVDVTGAVSNWFGGASNFGFAIASTSANVRLGSKEGLATGFPGILEIETSSAPGALTLTNLPAEVLTNSEAGIVLEGTFNGNGAGLTRLEATNIDNSTAANLTNANNTISGNGAGLTNLNASQLAAGTISLTQLPGSVITNGAGGVTLSGVFTGNGAGLTSSAGVGFQSSSPALSNNTPASVTVNSPGPPNPTNSFSILNLNTAPTFISPPLIDPLHTQLNQIGTEDGTNLYCAFNGAVIKYNCSANWSALLTNGSFNPQLPIGCKVVNHVVYIVSDVLSATNISFSTSNRVTLLDTNLNVIAYYGLNNPNTLQDLCFMPDGTAWLVPFSLSGAPCIFIYETNTWTQIGTVQLSTPLYAMGGIVWNPWKQSVFIPASRWGLFGTGDSNNSEIYTVDLSGNVAPFANFNQSLFQVTNGPSHLIAFGGPTFLSNDYSHLVICQNWIAYGGTGYTNNLWSWPITGGTSTFSVVDATIALAGVISMYGNSNYDAASGQVGDFWMDMDDDLALGHGALFTLARYGNDSSPQRAYENIAIGTGALHDLSPAGDAGDPQANVAIGYLALYDQQTGGGNVAVGTGSMQDLNAPYYSQNTALGMQSMQGATAAAYDTAVGALALIFARTGSNNIGIGYEAGYSWTSTEENNIAIGNQGTLGQNNTILIGTAGLHTNTFIAGVLHGDGGGLVHTFNGSTNATIIGTAAGVTNTSNKYGTCVVVANSSTWYNFDCGGNSLYTFSSLTGTYTFPVGTGAGVASTNRNLLSCCIIFQ